VSMHVVRETSESERQRAERGGGGGLFALSECA